MPSKRPRRPYPVDWDESRWEQALWRPRETFRPILELIEEVARAYDRQHLMDELVHSPLDIHVSLAVDEDGRVSFGDIETWDRRAVVLTHAIHRTMRKLAREEAARMIRQVDVPDMNGTTRRKVVVRWDRQKLTTATQIKNLHNAIQSGSQFKIEKAWFGLTPRAHEYLSVGYEITRRLGIAAAHKGAREVPATIIPELMLAPELLRVILPYAVRAVSRPGRRPVHPRDEALAKILHIFVEVSGHASAGARRGGYNEPIGPGADFARRVEAVFGVRLMPDSSTHAVERAMTRMPGR
jgi:hypothetical protein